MTGERTNPAGRRWWSWAGAAVGISALAYVLLRVDYDSFVQTLAAAHVGYLAAVPAAIALEQLVRAWKWRQILHPLRPVATPRLFGAVMAGYLGNLLIPFGAGPLVRSWLLARLERMRMSAILATVAIDRLIDGVVFAVLVAVVLALAVFPDPTGTVRRGLIVGAVGSLFLIGAVLWLLPRYKREAANAGGRLHRLAGRLPARWSAAVRDVLASFADGIVWPDAPWRRAGIIVAGVVIKIIAATHFLWAGLAFGVLLRPLDYLFLIVFLGFLIVLTHFARLAGGFIVGAIFALDLVGVATEQALAMVLAVQVSTLVTVAGIGALALWRSGIALSDLREARESRG